jgi:hypothetical protein
VSIFFAFRTQNRRGKRQRRWKIPASNFGT